MKFEDNYESCSRTYATLLIYSGDTAPEEVSGILDIAPTRISIAQEVPRKVLNGWYFSTQELFNSKDSRRHVGYLIEQIIKPVSSKINTLQSNGMSVEIACFWESATGNGGPSMPASQMKSLGEYGIDLYWDIWFADEESV